MTQKQAAQHAPASPRHDVEVIDLNDEGIKWFDDALDEDPTPVEYGTGKRAVVYESEDGRVRVALWRRAYEMGRLNPTSGAEHIVRKFDIVVEGEVTVRQDSGQVHVAGPGQALTYTTDAKGTWEHTEPISKIVVTIAE